MAASPAKTGSQTAEGKRHHGVVVIRLPGNRDGWPAAAASSAVDEEAVAVLDRAGAAAGGDGAGRGEDERPREAFSLWRAAGVVLALAALALAGYLCLYADAGAGAGVAWRFLAAGEDERGDRASFLLPLYPKARRGGVRAGARGGAAQNLTAAVLPLTGNVFPTGQYYTTLSIGNPPRPYFLDVDTGSDWTWIQCDAPCRSCAKGPHPLYRPVPGNIIPSSDPFCQEFPGNLKFGGKESPNQCDYDLRYADRSSSLGVHARDNMQLVTEDGERKNLDIVFGCGYDQQGNLLTSLEKTDGILGLSGATISLPTQLASKGIISNVFGHCMTTDPSCDGYLFLGDDYIPKWGMTWIPILKRPDKRYNTEVQKVNYGDQHHSKQGLVRKVTRVIFDSGSTYTYFPREVYTNLIAVLKDVSPGLVQDDSDNTLPFCMKADVPLRSVDEVKHLFKPLSLQLKNRLFIFPRTFTIPPEGYLIINDKGNVCLGIHDGSDILGSAILLGDVSFRGKLVAYDNEENQIGWAESDCTNPRKLSRLPFFLRRALRNRFL